MTLLIWEGWDSFRAEVAHAELGPHGLRARGTQIGRDYRLDYELDTDPRLVTRSLCATAASEGLTRELDLRRDEGGRWTANGEELAGLDGGDDVDLAFSPLFNTMPALRAGLIERDAAQDFTMAFVTVPELEVRPSAQRYEHVRRGVVRYRSGDFSSELEYDADGFVVTYPLLARRLAPNPSRQLA